MGSNKLISPLRWKPVMELHFPTWWYIKILWVICLAKGQCLGYFQSDVRCDWSDLITGHFACPFKFRIFFKESWSNWELFHIALVHQVESDRLRTLPGGPWDSHHRHTFIRSREDTSPTTLTLDFQVESMGDCNDRMGISKASSCWGLEMFFLLWI